MVLLSSLVMIDHSHKRHCVQGTLRPFQLLLCFFRLLLLLLMLMLSQNGWEISITNNSGVLPFYNKLNKLNKFILKTN